MTGSPAARILAAFACVDYVVVFGEPDPVALVRALRPDVHVKGGDYELSAIVEKEAGRSFPADPFEQLWGGITAVFKSWNAARAVEYRRINRIPHDWGTAVNVQAMVFGNMGDTSATGVAFTRDPSTGEKAYYGEWLVNAQGEDVVAGIRTPQYLTKAAREAAGAKPLSMEEAMPEAYAELAARYRQAASDLRIFRSAALATRGEHPLRLRFGDLSPREHGTVLDLDPLEDREDRARERPRKAPRVAGVDHRGLSCCAAADPELTTALSRSTAQYSQPTLLRSSLAAPAALRATVTSSPDAARRLSAAARSGRLWCFIAGICSISTCW